MFAERLNYFVANQFWQQKSEAETSKICASYETVKRSPGVVHITRISGITVTKCGLEQQQQKKMPEVLCEIFFLRDRRKKKSLWH